MYSYAVLKDLGEKENLNLDESTSPHSSRKTIGLASLANRQKQRQS